MTIHWWYDFFVAYSGSISSSYTVVVISILILRFLIRSSAVRQESINWLYVFNTVLLVSSIFTLISSIIEVFANWQQTNQQQLVNNAFSLSYYIQYTLAALAPLFMINKQFRKSLACSILVAVLINWQVWRDICFYFLADYLPSSWRINYAAPFLPIVAKWLLVVGYPLALYLYLHKKNRLPLPSLYSKPITNLCTRLFN